jgi:plastocyanin
MKRSLWVGIVLGYVVLALAGPAAMVRESVLGRGEAPGAPAQAAPAADAEGDGGTTVAMAGLEFAPAELTVRKGTAVLFENDDVAPHTVTAEAAGVDSGVIGPGKSFELVADESFEYLCTIHPSMRAKVTVTA